MSDVVTVLWDVWVKMDRSVVVVDPDSDALSEPITVPDQMDFDHVTMRGPRKLTADECYRLLCHAFEDMTEVGWTDEDGVSHVRGAP